MRRVDISPEADLELEEVLTRSATEFGLAAAGRYRVIVHQAYLDLAENPERPGVGALEGIPAELRLYPIRYSRDRVPAGARVKRARHVIAFRYDEDRVEIVHLLHDAMDLPGRLG